MKICPFISHLLGDECSNTLTIANKNSDRVKSQATESEDVVILGYNGEGGSAVQTDVVTETQKASEAAVHYHCLRESCRFYHKNSEDCQFDLIFGKLQDHTSTPQDGTGYDIAKDVDKIWKFQTKAVAEIVESLADTERK